MALPESSLSIVCASIAQFVKNGVNATANNISVSMGAPAEVPDNHSLHRLNLFFYRFEPSGFEAAAHPQDPWRIRVFCVITAFGIEDDDVAAGENELRVLGEVMRIFREQPILDAVSVNGESVRLQVVFNPVPADQLNQVWSTQGDTAYRPSIFYEMALAPIVPSQRRAPALRVGSIGHEVRGAADARFDAFAGNVSAPPVPAREVDIGDPRWVPELCWVYQDACHRTLALDVGTADAPGVTPGVWVAGDTADSVDLVWQVWGETGWQSAGSPTSVTPYSTAIDPDHLPGAVPGTFPQSIALPFTLASGATATQGLLYAVRTVTPTPARPPVELRSQPLLISLYRGS